MENPDFSVELELSRSDNDVDDDYVENAIGRRLLSESMDSRALANFQCCPEFANVRIMLVRHGEALSNVKMSVLREVSDHTVPLSPYGGKQARSAGLFLQEFYNTNPKPGKKKVFCSPYKRARETVQHIVSQLSGIDHAESIFLVEQHFGLFSGLRARECKELYPQAYELFNVACETGGRFWARPPMGESRFDVAGRINAFFSDLRRDVANGYTDFIVVAHGVTLRAFHMMWFNHTAEWFENELNPSNCSVQLFDEGTYFGYVFKPKEKKPVITEQATATVPQQEENAQTAVAPQEDEFVVTVTENQPELATNEIVTKTAAVALPDSLPEDVAQLISTMNARMSLMQKEIDTLRERSTPRVTTHHAQWKFGTNQTTYQTVISAPILLRVESNVTVTAQGIGKVIGSSGTAMDMSIFFDNDLHAAYNLDYGFGSAILHSCNWMPVNAIGSRQMSTGEHTIELRVKLRGATASAIGALHGAVMTVTSLPLNTDDSISL